MEELAQLYEAMAKSGFDPRQVDQLEIWECASMLGLLRPEKAEEAQVDLIALRAAAARSGSAPPTLESVSASRRRPVPTLQRTPPEVR